VEKIIGRGSGFVAVEIPFTPRAKRVLELALEEARQLGHNYIGTEHLLLGLLREGEGVAARVLENLDADPSKIRSQVGICRGETQLLTQTRSACFTLGTLAVSQQRRHKFPCRVANSRSHHACPVDHQTTLERNHRRTFVAR